MKQLLPAFSLCLICTLLPGCSADSTPSAPAHYYGPAWKPQYQLGVRSAKADLARGFLAWETHANGEWEEYRILWCVRKLLAEKYGIEHRIRGHFVTGDNDARIRGYQSVMDPFLSSKLGADWKVRIHEEAKTFYRTHWHEVERQFFIDERDQPGYADYVRQHPISEQEQQTRNPLDKFYDYRDN